MATHPIMLVVPWEGPGVVARPSTIYVDCYGMGWGGGVGGPPPLFYILFFCLKTNHTFLKIRILTKGVILTGRQFRLESSQSWPDSIRRKIPNCVFVNPAQLAESQTNFDCLYLLHPDSDWSVVHTVGIRAMSISI